MAQITFEETNKFVMKVCTDIEQSKKLAEILPIESADMFWDTLFAKKPEAQVNNHHFIDEYDDEHRVPAWSLAALIELMGECRMERTPLDQTGEFTHSFVDDYFNIRTYEEYDAVDAAVEMILKLKEKDLL